MIWPFEKDTKKTEKKLAARNLAANKQRNFLTGIIIFISSLLLSFSTTLLCNATIDTQIISRVDNTLEMIVVILSISIILLFTAGIAIKNIMYISVLQRTREFAQLKTIGATYRQIKTVLHHERKNLSRKYIVCGLLLGLICNFILPLKFYFAPSIICAVFSGAFIWFIVFLSFRTPAKLAASLPPIAALKSEDGNISKISKRSIHITTRNLATKYFCSNSKKSAYTLLSLVLSGGLMFIVFSVISAINIEKLVRQSYYENSSIYLMLNSTADENSTYALMKNTPFTGDLKTQIENISGVTEIHASKKIDCEITVENSKYEISLNSIVGTSSFETLLVEGNMPYPQNTITSIPIVINRISPYYKRMGLHLELGDHLSMSVDTGRSIQKTDFSVCGFIENKDRGSVFYTSPEYLDFLSEINCDLIWYICTDSEQTNTAVKEIKVLVNSDDRLIVSVFSDDLSETQTYFQNAKIVVIAITILTSLFAFINLLNTCITNTVTRSRDYALLEAGGMTKKQIRQMQGAENQIYFASSLAGIFLVGLPLGFFLCGKIAEIPGLSYVSYRFPWPFLALYFVFLFLVLIMVTEYQRRILMKRSVVERIRANE